MDLDLLFKADRRAGLMIHSVGTGISFEEWSWRSMDRQLDAYRQRKNLRPYPQDRRDRELKLYLESLTGTLQCRVAD